MVAVDLVEQHPSVLTCSGSFPLVHNTYNILNFCRSRYLLGLVYGLCTVLLVWMFVTKSVFFQRGVNHKCCKNFNYYRQLLWYWFLKISLALDCTCRQDCLEAYSKLVAVKVVNKKKNVIQQNLGSCTSIWSLIWFFKYGCKLLVLSYPK